VIGENAIVFIYEVTNVKIKLPAIRMIAPKKSWRIPKVNIRQMFPSLTHMHARIERTKRITPKDKGTQPHQVGSPYPSADAASPLTLASRSAEKTMMTIAITA